MNKYQEALNYVKFKLFDCADCPGCFRKGYCEKNCKDFKNVETLQELIDQQTTPTLEEVKKEWEELGYTFFEDDTHIKLYYCGGQVYIFDKKEKGIIVFPFITPFRTLNLLSKTLKALGWEE